MKAAEKIDIDKRYCKGCMLCLNVCKYEVFVQGQERSDLGYLMPYPERVEECQACRMCELHCPEMALYVLERQKR